MAQPVRALANQAFSRAAGAPLIEGNHVRLLKDAQENYAAWLEAIDLARRYVHFESYIIHDDDTGEMFAATLIAKAGSGVRVRVIYDWLGGFGKTSRGFWNRLRDGGVEVRCYNPPRLDAPFGWISRDHRKMMVVDGEVGFATGLCIGHAWVGNPDKGLDPWRDTGVEVRGPAVAELGQAFATIWTMLGERIPDDELAADVPAPCGTMAVRVVATEPATAGMFRLDQLIAALARERIWLADAYYAGTTPYVQALRAAAIHGVDVRLLVPNATDIPLLRPLSRAGYRPLLEAGVRVFEWNGTMMHAKTALADGRWARVGSTNLNVASWLGNCELDVVVEDETFAREMEDMYLADLTNSTEVVLDARRRVHAQGTTPGVRHRIVPGGRGSGGRAAVRAVRIGNTIGAAFTNRRPLEPLEARMTAIAGCVLLVLAVLFAVVPGLLAYPLVAVSGWIGAALLYRGYKLRRGARKRRG